jgi:hypothetical protein
LADGQRSLAAIRTETEAGTGFAVDEGALFAVLDALADAKLLASRVTPPGSTDLASFVFADGTLGSAFVEKGTDQPAQPVDKLKLPDARVREAAAKEIRRPLRAHESAQKRQDDAFGRAAKATGTAREEAKKAGDRMREREMNAKAKREAPSTQPSADEAALPALRQRSEALAKTESTLRKRSEQDAKARYQERALPGEDDASARKRQGATEADYKAQKQRSR